MPGQSDLLVARMDRCSGHLVWVLGLLEGLTVPLVVILARSGNEAHLAADLGIKAYLLEVALDHVAILAQQIKKSRLFYLYR